MINSAMADPDLVQWEEVKSKHVLATNALPRGEFLEKLHSDLDRMLDERNYHIWNGRAQIIVRRLIEQALPPLRRYTAKDNGMGHCEDIGNVLLHKLDDYEAFRAMELRLGLKLSKDSATFLPRNYTMDDALTDYDDRLSANRRKHRRDAGLTPRSDTLAARVQTPDDAHLYDTTPYEKGAMSPEAIEKALYGDKQL